MSNTTHAPAPFKAVIKEWRHAVTSDYGDETMCWTCRVYTIHHDEFLEWMHRNFPEVPCSYRFNSGAPVYTVRFRSEQEATVFKLKWNFE